MAKRTKASARKKGAARKAVGPVKPIPAAYHVRDVHVSAIVDAVKKLCIDANLELEPDMLRAFDRALTTERSPAGKQVLQILKDNAQMAKTRRIPYCQDTGFVVCFVELGQDVHVTGGAFYDAINEGVRQGYREGYLRASIVRSPLDRVNTGDNTPAVIHVDVVPGAELKLAIMAKGGGCENRSKYTMLTPAAGIIPCSTRWRRSCSRAPTGLASARRAMAATRRRSASTCSRIPATSRRCRWR